VPGHLKTFLEHVANEGVSVGQALQAVADALSIDVQKQFSTFLDDSAKKKPFLKAAAAIVSGALPTSKEDTWDHSYFFVDAQGSHAVCGVASRQLAVVLREEKKESTFLTAEFIASCTSEANRWVQAFRAEEIVISAVNTRGFIQIQGEQHTIVVPTPFKKVAYIGLGQLVAGTYHCMPPAGFEFLDSVIVVVPTNKQNAIKIFAQQTTFQSVAQHKHSRDFFDAAYKDWQKAFTGKRAFEWHLVWVLTAKEKKLQHSKPKKGKPSQHGLPQTDKKCAFVEWFFAFADFEPRLDL
jgi:hypothetical protein